MSRFDLDQRDRLYYLFTPPAGDGPTFVFFNALTGDAAMWEGGIGARLRDAGHGTLSFNYRGQAGSDFAPGTALDPALIVDDAVRLLQHLRPPRAVLAGLSIGGLFAARAWLTGIQGVDAAGLVLINTLRRDGARLRWINDAVVRCAEVGGLDLFRDLFLPLLFGEGWLGAHRKDFLKDGAYAPLAADSGHYNLLKHGGGADWDLPYERLDLPTLVVSGLQDHVFFDAGAVAELAARLPRARRLDLADAGHLVPAECPDVLADELLAFAAEV